ncbi:hypothetical protein [Paenibacillus sp. BIHB 4019]|uniref:hypothetical protein n=1 Tax=Paenibacillus sp. BIHB 4019 TaxID=1870819 RepID=UPI0012379495|nr:hypothetical protein [Paenibacillus sp. BIHB 4019]
MDKENRHFLHKRLVRKMPVSFAFFFKRNFLSVYTRLGKRFLLPENDGRMALIPVTRSSQGD